MFKKLSIISVVANIILGVAVALVCFFLMLLPALNDNASYKEKALIYSDCTYDFIAPSPVKEQVEEMKEQPFIKSVYEYYLYTSTVSSGKNSVKVEAMFSESDNLVITPFNNERLISEGEGDIYITKSVAESLDVNIGGEVTVGVAGKSLTFKVGRIFLDDGGKYGKVIFSLTDGIKSEIDLEKLQFTGVYIEANDLSATKNYLNSFIPLGMLLTREYFDSDLQYETYKEDFMAQNYSSLINSKSVSEETALRVNDEYLTDSEDMLIKSVAVIGVAMFLIVILNLGAILAYNKFIAQNSGFIISFTWKTILLFSLFALLAVICCMATLGILCATQTAGMLFVNSFGTRAIGYGLLSAFLGGFAGGLINTAFCALRRS